METNETQHIEDQDKKEEGAAPAEEQAPLPVESEESMADLLKAQAEVSGKVYSRDIVTVKVVQVNQEFVFVDIGEKKEAVIPFSDFQDEKTPEPGDEVQAILEKKGGEGRNTILSHRRARERAAIAAARAMFEAKERVKGRVTEAVKGGYIVDISGVRAFMPLSLSELGGAHKHYLPPGAKVKIYITDFNEKERKIVVSRRQVLEEDEKLRRAQVLGEVRPGDIVRGVVSKVTDEGILVRFQGIEGFVQLADVAWKSPEAEIKNYKRGQRVKCKVLSLDKETERLSFSFKQLMPNPVDMLKRKFARHARLKAKVVSVTKEGALVKIGEQTEGFVSPEEYGADGEPKEGQEITGVLTAINSANFRLVLSIRRSEEQEDRKRVAQYLKGSPSLTLGQILLENSEDEGEL
ncbi:MAG TPA: S1 RNA-binding domain-containing protein [Elusimicrobiales bacterium]|nr:S1 RNA-binding domain-containing protein [Elusimicrobiales bacterium]